MVQVMQWVTDGHVPEETMIFPQDLVCPGPHLPTHPDHDPSPPVTVPGAPSREKVGQHVLQYHLRKRLHYLLLSPIPLKLIHVCIYVSLHQKLRSPGSLFERCDDTIY